MRIKLQNEIGSFEVGGGSHPIARITSITGIGIPAKEDKTITFEGQSGSTLTSYRDLDRTITMSFDFYGDEYTVEKLYRIIYNPLTMTFYLNGRRRKIDGICKMATEIENIIYHRWQKIVLQFTCYDPYFKDVSNTRQPISKVTNHLPNINENTEWYVQLPTVATTRENKGVVINSGNVDVYPIITLQNNQGVSVLTDDNYITVRNLTTGKAITINYLMITDEIVTVDLPNRRITSSINGNITNYISSDTVLGDFMLQLGENEIEIESTNNDIYAVIEYSNKYASVVI